MLAARPALPAAEEHAGDLRSSDPSVREHAAVSLGRAGDRSAVPALIEVLKDPEKDVRRAAAKALGFIKGPRAVPSLLAALGDTDTNIRLYAAYGLGEIKDPKATAALLRALGDPEWCVRDQAAWALREIGDPDIAGPLAAVLKEPGADAAHVVWILRHLGAAQAVDRLAALLDDPDRETRLRAVGALGALGDKAAVGPMIAALKDSDPAVRRSAVEALAAIGGERAKKPLRELVAREEDPAVRQAAEEALFEMSPRKHLVAHWSFDDRNTKVAKDVTGTGHDGQVLGCTPVEGKAGHALRFAGDSYVELGKLPGLPIAQRPLTIMAWAKSDAANGVVVARGGASCGFSLYVKDGVAKFGIHREAEGPGYIAAGSEKVAGRWVHLAGVIKSDRIELYVGGKLAQAAKTPGTIPGNCGQGMEIGYDAGNSPAEITDHFRGVIDEVKVYHAALSEEDIAKEAGLEPPKPKKD